MYSIIRFIVKIYSFIIYNTELKRVQFRRKFNSISTENKILEEIYKEYLERVLSGEIFPKSKHGYRGISSSKKKNIFLRFRTANNGFLTKANEEYLIAKLNCNIAKWYVPYVLSVVNSFSERLMEELLKTAIKVRDPSYNSCFIKPAMRVHNLEVHDYLTKIFSKSTQNQKRGILRAFYWLRPPAVWRKETGEVNTDYSTKYIWKKQGYFEKDYNISEIELIRNKDKFHLRYANKIEVLMHEYLTTKSKRMKEYIDHYLPNDIEDFPEKLREIGLAYLQKIEK